MYDKNKKLIALSSSNVQAGFPSPADDFMESELNLHDYLVHNSKSTFMVRVSGESMIGAGILAGDILIVDRSAQYKNNSIIIAVLDGDLTVKRLVKSHSSWRLQAESNRPYFIPVTDNSLEVWGVVTGVVRKL